MSLLSIEQAIEHIRQGRMVILVDDEDRENEGDLTIAAEKVTPETINFMAKFGRGLICLSLTGEKIDSLGLPPMVDNNTSPFGTGFTVGLDRVAGFRFLLNRVAIRPNNHDTTDHIAVRKIPAAFSSPDSSALG